MSEPPAGKRQRYQYTKHAGKYSRVDDNHVQCLGCGSQRVLHYSVWLRQHQPFCFPQDQQPASEAAAGSAPATGSSVAAAAAAVADLGQGGDPAGAIAAGAGQHVAEASDAAAGAQQECGAIDKQPELLEPGGEVEPAAASSAVAASLDQTEGGELEPEAAPAGPTAAAAGLLRSGWACRTPEAVQRAIDSGAAPAGIVDLVQSAEEPTGQGPAADTGLTAEEEDLQDAMEELDAASEDSGDEGREADAQQQAPAGGTQWRASEPRPGSGVWYFQHRGDPVYATPPGEPPAKSMLQVVASLLHEKDAHGLTRTAFESNLRLLKSVLPPNNVLPGSLHLCRRVVAAPALEQFEQHACPNLCCVFPHLSSRAAWAEHKEDTCPECETGRRFEWRQAASGRVIVTPLKPFWYFGLQRLLQKWWQQPEFKRLREEGIAGGRGGYMAAAEYARLVEATGGVAADPTTLFVDLGIDWGSPYHGVSHSVGVVALRSADMPAAELGRSAFADAVLIIPGRREPTSVDVYLEPLLSDLRRHGPGVHGFTPGPPLELVSATRPGEAGAAGAVRTQHRVVLRAVHADTPARGKVAKGLGPAAYLCCLYCLMQAVRRPGGGMSPMGYCQPVHQELLAASGDPQPEARIGDARLRLDHAAMDRRGRGVQCGQLVPGLAGCNGHSAFIRWLPYTSYKDLFLVAPFHALVYGLGKQLMGLLLERTAGAAASEFTLSAEAKRRLQQRLSCVFYTREHGRPPADLAAPGARLTMEDYFHFFESSGPLTLRGLLHPLMEQAFFLLRQAMLHYLRAQKGGRHSFTLQSRRAGAKALLKLAKLYERHQPAIPMAMCSPNLHVLVCRAYEQEDAQGPLATSTELWQERQVKAAKRDIAGHLSRSPERVYLSRRALREALQPLAAEVQPGAAAAPPPPEGEPSASGAPGGGSSEAARANRDQGEQGGVVCLGAGALVRGAARPGEAEIVEHHLAQAAAAGHLEPGWQPGDARSGRAELYRHSRAFLPAAGSLEAASYARATAKQSFWLLLEFAGQAGGVERRVARAEYFLRARAAGRPDLRLAVVTIFEPKSAGRRPDNAPELHAIRLGSVLRERWPAPLRGVAGMLVGCEVRDPRPLSARGPRCTPWYDRREDGKLYFLQAANASRFC